MTIPAVAKIGGTAVVAAGVPTTVYLTSDYIFFYEVERKIMNEEVSLQSTDTPAPTSIEGSTFITTISYESNKWSCEMYAKLIPSDSGQSISDTEKTKLKEYIKKNLSIEASTPEISSDVKQANKRQMIWDCSGDRTVEEENKNIKTKMIFSVTKNSTENKLTVELFGKSVEVSTSTAG